ncbi:MAG TPA: PrsW family glutamic-type intramembrane protease [Anaerolineaceae bacterium]
MSQALISSSPPPQSNVGNSNFLPISQLVYSLGAALVTFGLALSLALFGLYGQLNQGAQYAQTAISLAWSLALMGVLLLPAAVLSVFRLFGRRLPGWIRGLLKFFDQISLFSILLWLLVLWAGVLATQVSSLSWLLLPPFNLLAVGLPILWIFSVGRRGLSAGSPLRHWGSFSIGVVVTPILSFTLELFLMLGVGVLAAILLGQNPNTAAELNRLIQRMLMSNGDTETITRSLRPIISRPEVLFAGLALMSGLIPLIEELLKPLPAWLLGKRLKTPAEGFVAGLLGGAGYALAESLGASGAFESSQWLSVVIGRAGTDLLHILTSGLMGLALFYAFREGKTLRLVLTYLTVVLIHGLWNFFSLWAGFYTFIIPSGPALTATNRLPAYISPIGLAILVVVMLTLLMWRNAGLRRVGVTQIRGTQTPIFLSGADPMPSGQLIASAVSSKSSVDIEGASLSQASLPETDVPEATAGVKPASVEMSEASTTAVEPTMANEELAPYKNEPAGTADTPVDLDPKL